MVWLQDQLYWRQSTRTNGNYGSRKVTARRWLRRYVGAECRIWLHLIHIKYAIQMSVRPVIVRTLQPTISNPVHIWYSTTTNLRYPYWDRVTHTCVTKLSILGSDNGLSPGRRQAIIWTNAGILLIWPFGTHFSEILIEIDTFSFKKMHLKMSSGKWRPFVSALMC